MGCGSSSPVQHVNTVVLQPSRSAAATPEPQRPTSAAAVAGSLKVKPQVPTDKVPPQRNYKSESPSLELIPAVNVEAGGTTSGVAATAADGSAVSPESLVRLLLVSQFAGFTEAVPCYENLPIGSYVDVQIDDYHSKYAHDTAVISWRWSRPKPSSAEAARSPVNNPVPVALVEYVSHLSERDNMKYLWLDWSCAPQYPEDLSATMREINRSGTYYATARGFYVWCFATRVTADSFEHSDYFYRAWTLSERLHRAATKGALTPSEFLPDLARTLFANKLRPVKEWGPPMAQIAAKASLSLVANDGHLDDSGLLELSALVVARYPVLAELAALIDGPLRTLLPPDAHAGLKVAISLRAIAEWISRPDKKRDDLTGAFHMQPLEFKQFMLHGLLNHSRMTLNNFTGKLASTLEDVAMVALEVIDTRSAPMLLEPVERMWLAALDTPTSETAASPSWLRRYLVFEAGRSYKAFSPGDLLFAIYKLFDLPDFSYGQEDELYAALLQKAEARFLSNLDHSPYGWLQELAVMSDKQADVLPAVLSTAKNCRANTAYVPSPANFGVFTLPSAVPANLNAAQKVPFPELFGPDTTDNVLTHVIGFHLDSGAQGALQRISQAGELPRVPKEQGGELDTHLSLRGRKALGLFEDKLHNAIAEQMVGAWEEDCGLFLVVRYGTMACLSKALLIRASCLSDAKEWTVEFVSAFGSEAQKGSSWGIAKALELLAQTVTNLPGVTQNAYSHFGDCGALAGNHTLDPLLFAPSGQVSWFTSRTLAFTAGKEPAVCSNASPVAAAAARSDGLAAVDKRPAIPDGETTFLDIEVELVEEAFQWMGTRDYDNESMTAYYRVLARNCVRGSVMADNLSFYVDLCNTLTMQLTLCWEEVTRHELLKVKFGELVEALADAVCGEGEDAEHRESAKQALSSLQAALDGSLFAKTSENGDGGEEPQESFEVPPGKTTMQDNEVELVEMAFDCCGRAGFSTGSVTDYYNLLIRNYVHDSVMAANLGFFTKLCLKYAEHLRMQGEVLLVHGALKRKFGEFIEDMADAIGDSEDEVCKAAAKDALMRLEEAMEASS